MPGAHPFCSDLKSWVNYLVCMKKDIALSLHAFICLSEASKTKAHERLCLRLNSCMIQNPSVSRDKCPRVPLAVIYGTVTL